MNIKKGMNGITFADIHYGHHKTTTDEIIEHFWYSLDMYKTKFRDIDIILLGGDVFDRLLSVGSAEEKSIRKWMSNLLEYAERYNIIIRSVEGTPSHDMNQMSTFDTMLKRYNVDFKHYSDIAVEYIEEYGVNILYIPDELYEENIVIEKIKSLTKNIEIHLILMHGSFQYQMPVKLESNKDEDWYSDLVSGFIFCGHHHPHSYYKNIIVPGSFDRLKQKEEEPKGFIYWTINPTLPKYWEFLENTKAKIYKTIEYTNMNALKRTLDKIPAGSYIRILTKEILDNDFKKHYKHLHFDVQTVTEDEIEIETSTVMVDSINITPDNISDLLADRIDLDKDTISNILHNI